MKTFFVAEAMEKNNDMELNYLNAKCEYLLKDYAAALEDFIYYKENTKSLEHIEEVNKIIDELEKKKESSGGIINKLFALFK